MIRAFYYICLVFFTLFLSVHASAESLSYSNVSGGLIDTEVNGFAGDGLFVEGNYQVNDRLYISGRFEDNEFSSAFDTSALSLGAGYIFPYDDYINFHAEGKIVRVDVEPGDVDTGIGLEFGARYLIAPQVELLGSLNLEDVSERDSFLVLGGYYLINDKFSAGGTMRLMGDADVLSVELRYFY